MLAPNAAALCIGAGGVVASSPSGVSEILPHLAIYRRRHLRERLDDNVSVAHRTYFPRTFSRAS